MKSVSELGKLPSGFEKTFIPNSSAALSRCHRLIRIEHEKEIVFMSICSQIHMDEFRKNRAEKQRKERRLKRESSS